MKIISPLPRKRGRIEIIPLIDIMFFLLAAFMMVSIHKIKVNMLKVSLPTDVPVSQLESKEDFVSVSINAFGQVQIDKELITDGAALLPKLQAIFAKNKDQKILISADKDARNGDVMAVLGKLRLAGFQKVAFNIKGNGTVPNQGAPAAPPAPEAAPPGPAAPPAPPGAPPSAPAAPPSPASAAAPPVPAAPVAPAPPASPLPAAAPTAPTKP
jgi:biopolymer transport protein ExbD